MTKHIRLSEAVWAKLHHRLSHDYPHSVIIIREKMKSVLGFTVRRHKEWVPKMDGGYYDMYICLDFYNEPKRTMFLLRYGEYLESSK